MDVPAADPASCGEGTPSKVLRKKYLKLSEKQKNNTILGKERTSFPFHPFQVYLYARQ